jgi:hypothetical protein
MRSASQIPWLRTMFLSAVLAGMFSLALIIVTHDWYMALILFCSETIAFFIILVVGMWWSDSKARS